jgi:DNA-binding CsgD family transcriptional regulator
MGAHEPWRLLIDRAQALPSRHRSLDAFAVAAVAGARAIVGCDLAAYHEYDPVDRRAIARDDPAGTITPDLIAAFIRHADQHPTLRAHLAGHAGPLSLDDFLSGPALRRLALYDAYYRPLGITQQICFRLPTGLPGPSVTGVALSRARGSFTDDERLLLDHWRVHLTNALERERLHERHDRLRHAIDDCGLGVVVLDAANQPMLVTPVAEGQLATYLGGGPDGRLPTPLEGWLRHRETAASTPITFEHGGRSLHIRFLAADAPDASDLLLLEEHAPIDRTTAREVFGLTGREAEILELVAAGRSNAATAAELHISPATVKQHLAHVYAKLDVRSRTAAVARLRQALPANDNMVAEAPLSASAPSA